jgi:short-subunit dehydrogenase
MGRKSLGGGATRFAVRGSHAVVTGASRGIGRQLARELATRGARVTVVARSAEPLKELADEIDGNATAVDLGDAEGLSGLVARIEAESGPVDMLFNNAAVAVVDRLTDQSADDIRSSFMLNCVAPAELSRQVLPGMLARQRGRIANVASMAGITALPTLSIYGGTKAGLAQFSAALRRELRRTAVRVTLVQLGEVAGTEMMEVSRQSPTIAAISKRLARTHAMPNTTAETVVRKVVDATAAGRRDCVVPARIQPIHAVRELPSRFNDLLMIGID